MTAQVRDRLGEVATLLADLPVAPGVKQRTKPPAQFLRPETELDKARRAIQEAKDKAADDRLMDLGAKAKERWRAQQTTGGTA